MKRLQSTKARVLAQMAAGRISGDDFSEVYDPLKIEIAAVEERLSALAYDELDVDASLSYLESCFWNTTHMWQAEGLAGKQRLQKLIFPAGVMWDGNGFGTPQPVRSTPC